VVLILGSTVRLVAGGLTAPSLSATVLGALLWLGLWLTVLLLTNPRVAFWVGLVAMAVLDVAALAPRAGGPYDEREALYRTDQSMVVPVPSGATSVQVLVEPVFNGTAPGFGLAGDLNGAPLAWTCPLRLGVQRVELPLPLPASAPLLRLHLT